MRNITKSFATTSANVEVMHFNKDGEMQTLVTTFEGCKSERAARARLKSLLKTDNYILKSCEIVKGNGETRYTMDAELFYSLASVCTNGVTYGHDTVTVQFTVSYYDYYDVNGTKHVFTVLGKTTTSKALKAIREELNTQDVMINPNPTYSQTRMFMTREEFIAYATEC